MSELNIGGSNMTVELRENTLYAESNTGNKQWVAVLTDTHPKYNYDREFVAYQKPKTSDRDSGTATVEDGAVIERVRYTHSGKNRKDRFYHSEDEEEDESEAETETTEVDSENDTRGVAVADGGLEVREFNDIRHTDALVREYTTPPGDRLYAYRSGDGDHHIVVSRGDEPGTRWEKRVPATVERPIPGQKLWTLPENWDQRAVSKRDNIAYGLFYVPESDVWARVSIPTNDWLTDAWYQVKAVGDLDVEPVGELGSSYEVRQLANDYEEKYDADGVEDDAEVIREIASNWEAVEEDLRHSTEWVRSEGLDQMQPGDQPIPVDADWQIEFHDRVFQPGDVLKQVVDLSESEIELSIIFDELRDAGLLPSHYSFELTLDDSAIDMEFYTRGLIESGASPAEAMDYYMVEVKDMTQTAWAEERGVDQSTVSGNVSQAKGVFK